MVTLTTVSSESANAKLLISKWATAEDLAQANLRRNKKKRHNSLLARATLRALLAHVTETGDWQIQPDSHGKPHVFTPTGVTAPHISLSHTQGLVACAVSRDNPLGIDVEHWRVRDFMALANYAFGPREQEEVAREGISAFYRIWTLREAIAKASGTGLFATLDGHDYVANAPTYGCFTIKAWQLFYCSLQTNYSLAVASKGNNVWTDASLVLADATAII
jgi:4'-phosphopantetheinyl transferase